MGGEVDDLDEVLDRLASMAVSRARLEADRLHYARVRRLGRVSSKAVYMLLKDHEPQSLASFKRIIGLSKSSAIRARDELVEAGFVTRDDQFNVLVGAVYPEELDE